MFKCEPDILTHRNFQFDWNLTSSKSVVHIVYVKRIFIQRKKDFQIVKMNTMQKEETVQAVLIADTYDKTLQPFVTTESTVSH